MRDLNEPEPFDPSAYKHPHAPNETCDICALLGEIERLNQRVQSMTSVVAVYRGECEQAKHEKQLEYERRVRERDEQNATIADLQRQLEDARTGVPTSASKAP